jgi:hypothetical protein
MSNQLAAAQKMIKEKELQVQQLPQQHQLLQMPNMNRISLDFLLE